MPVLEELIGEILDGKYRIDKKLGQGGMGAVYLATHVGTERNVALKVITPQFMLNPESVERFRREARAAGRLRHPNVVNVTDFGFANFHENKIAYLVMEYLNGCSLGDLLRKKQQLPLDFIVDVVEQVCLAIEEAHKQGIIHRDLKPDNIWLQPNGRGGFIVKVLDFGLAKLRHPDSDNVAKGTGIRDFAKLTADMNFAELQAIETANIKGDTLNNDVVQTVHTRAGAVLGTPIYMSPEQIMGEGLDARSDIYSLGVIVYQMLIGEPPFKGTLIELMVKHTTQPAPSLLEKRPELSRSVAATVMSALAKTTEERPVTAMAFATRLRANSEGEGPILRESVAFYSKHFKAALKLSFISFFIFILLNIAMLVGVEYLRLSKISRWLNHAIHLVHWGISLLLLLLGCNINIAAFTLALDQLRKAPLNSINVSAIFSKLIKRSFAIITTSLRGYLIAFAKLFRLIVPGAIWYIKNSLASPVVVMEGKQGEAALNRSRELTGRIYSLAARIQAREFSLALLSMLIFMISLVIGHIALDLFNMVMVTKVPTLLFFILIPSVLIILLHPTLAIAMGKIYTEARHIGGEKVESISRLEFENLLSENRPKVTFRRTGTILITAVAMLLVWLITPTLTLRFVVSRGYFHAVRALLAAGADANMRGSDTLTPLMVAAANGDTESLKLLLSAGADVNAQTDRNWTALMYAADNGRTQAIEMLVAAGANINARHIYGSTPIFRAARHGYNDAVKALIAGGADVNIRNNIGLTALLEAISDQGDINTVMTLIAAGADVNAHTNNGNSALTIAKDKGNMEMYQFLKSAGAE